VLHTEVFLLEDKSTSVITRGRVFFFKYFFLFTTSSLRCAGTVLSIAEIGRMSKLLPLKYSLTYIH
jgi:hypothetical protein